MKTTIDELNDPGVQERLQELRAQAARAFREGLTDRFITDHNRASALAIMVENSGLFQRAAVREETKEAPDGSQASVWVVDGYQRRGRFLERVRFINEKAWLRFTGDIKS